MEGRAKVEVVSLYLAEFFLVGQGFIPCRRNFFRRGVKPRPTLSDFSCRAGLYTLPTNFLRRGVKPRPTLSDFHLGRALARPSDFAKVCHSIHSQQLQNCLQHSNEKVALNRTEDLERQIWNADKWSHQPCHLCANNAIQEHTSKSEKPAPCQYFLFARPKISARELRYPNR